MSNLISSTSGQGNFSDYQTKKRGIPKDSSRSTKKLDLRIDPQLVAKGDSPNPSSSSFTASIASSNVVSKASTDSAGSLLEKNPIILTPVRSSDTDREVLIQRMQQRISELDLANPQLKGQVKAIQQELKSLKPLLDSSIDLSYLEKTLALLIDHTPLKVSVEELELIHVVGEKYNLDNYKLATYMDQEGSTIRDVKSILLKNLKENNTSIQDLCTICKDFYLEVQMQIIKERCKNFCNSVQLPLNNQFFTNFSSLVRITFFYREIREKELQAEWKSLLAHYDERTNSRFSRDFSNNSNIDISKCFPDFIKQSQGTLFQDLDCDLMNRMKLDEFILYFTQKINQLQDPFIDFADTYKNNFQKFLWITENIERIKKSYCQNNEIHTNLGRGVCYNNCLFRYAQIENTPLIPSEELLIGSNEKTRYGQIKYRAFQKAFATGRPSTEKRGLEQEKLYSFYRLKKVDAFKNTQTLLVMYDQSLSSAHALNLQFDKEKGIYRFIDDNFGLVEFECEKKMDEELRKYLQAFYPEFPLLFYECFDPIKN